jgi:trans-aconitate methyltransferase
VEEAYVPDRELRIGALIDVVDAVAGSAPTVVDLACGTGTITRRLLDRLPETRSIPVDVDPVLLTVAAATFADDGRVRLVRADLRDRDWSVAVRGQRVDAVLTATALDWLREDVVSRVYRDLACLVREGGVVAHAEEMPLVELPRLATAMATLEHKRRSRTHVESAATWEAWWEQAAQDPALRAATAQRRAVFATDYPAEDFSPPAEWHIAALRKAGFAEVGVVWRSGTGAVVAAVR